MNAIWLDDEVVEITAVGESGRRYLVGRVHEFVVQRRWHAVVVEEWCDWLWEDA